MLSFGDREFQAWMAVRSGLAPCPLPLGTEKSAADALVVILLGLTLSLLKGDNLYDGRVWGLILKYLIHV